MVARNYLIGDRPDAIINIIDGTNIERNLYLSTQIMELGIPVIMAINMMDVVEKNGDKIHTDKLSKRLGCEVVEISALKGTGIQKAAEKAVSIAQKKNAFNSVHEFAPEVESVIDRVAAKLNSIPEEQKRFFAIKLLEKDDKIQAQMTSVPDVSAEIKELEDKFDDDTESIITNERYVYISSIIGECVTKKHGKDKLTTSDKIDKIVTNRWLALPIFAVVMYIVYYVSVTTVGGIATDWANEGVFGDGWFLAGVGRSSFDEDTEAFDGASAVVNAFAEDAGNDSLVEALDAESDDFDADAATAALKEFAPTVSKDASVTYTVEDEETLAESEETATGADFADAVTVMEKWNCEAPDPADGYGVWIPGIPVLLENVLSAAGVSGFLMAAWPDHGWYRSRCRRSTWIRSADPDSVYLPCLP